MRKFLCRVHVCAKFHENPRGSGFFYADLVWNDPNRSRELPVSILSNNTYKDYDALVVLVLLLFPTLVLGQMSENLNICSFNRFLTNVFLKQTFITIVTMVYYILN